MPPKRKAAGQGQPRPKRVRRPGVYETETEYYAPPPQETVIVQQAPPPEEGWKQKSFLRRFGDATLNILAPVAATGAAALAGVALAKAGVHVQSLLGADGATSSDPLVRRFLSANDSGLFRMSDLDRDRPVDPGAMDGVEARPDVEVPPPVMVPVPVVVEPQPAFVHPQHAFVGDDAVPAMMGEEIVDLPVNPIVDPTGVFVGHEAGRPQAAVLPDVVSTFYEDPGMPYDPAADAPELIEWVDATALEQGLFPQETPAMAAAHGMPAEAPAPVELSGPMEAEPAGGPPLQDAAADMMVYEPAPRGRLAQSMAEPGYIPTVSRAKFDARPGGPDNPRGGVTARIGKQVATGREQRDALRAARRDDFLDSFLSDRTTPRPGWDPDL